MSFDQAKAEQITSRLSAGEPMAQICRDPNMPAVTTVWNWQQQNPSFAESIARAREAGFDVIAAQCLPIADDVPTTSEDVQKAKLRVETRLKLLAKWDSKRYGDRIAVDADVRLQVELIDASQPQQAIAQVVQQAPQLLPGKAGEDPS